MNSKLVLPDGCYKIPTDLLLRAVDNPFVATIWEGCSAPLDRVRVSACLSSGTFERDRHNCYKTYPLDWHERRVAYLAHEAQKSIAQGGIDQAQHELGPIELELPINALDHLPQEIMIDGFHRLAAFILLDIKLVVVTVGGDIFELVRLVRKGNDQAFTARFESEFTTDNPDIDMDTGLVIELID